MKTVGFISFALLSFLLITVGYWLLGKLFAWYIWLNGLWFYFLTFWFAFLTYRFALTNLALFRLRKTIFVFLSNSVLKWSKQILLILLTVYGCIYVGNVAGLQTGYSTWQFVGYWIFMLLTIQLTINLIFQGSTGE